MRRMSVLVTRKIALTVSGRMYALDHTYPACHVPSLTVAYAQSLLTGLLLEQTAKDPHCQCNSRAGTTISLPSSQFILRDGLVAAQCCFFQP